MPKIKTRESRKSGKDIKALDKAAIAGERMKDAYLRSRDTAARLEDDSQGSPSEYAGDQVQRTSEELVHDAGYVAVEQGRRLAVKGREAARAMSEEAQERSSKHFFGTTSEEPPPSNDASVQRGRLYAQQSAQARTTDPQRGAKTREQTVGREPDIRTYEKSVPTEKPVPAERWREYAVQQARINSKEMRRDRSSFRGDKGEASSIAASPIQREQASVEQGRQAAIRQAQIKTKEAQRERGRIRQERFQAPTADAPSKQIEPTPVERARQAAVHQAKIKTKGTQPDRSRIRVKHSEPPTTDNPVEQIEPAQVDQGRQVAVQQRRIKTKETQQDRIRFREEQSKPRTIDSPTKQIEPATLEQGEQMPVHQEKTKARETGHDRKRLRQEKPANHATERPSLPGEVIPAELVREYPIQPTETGAQEMRRNQGLNLNLSKGSRPAVSLPAKEEPTPVEKGRQLAINRAKAKAKVKRLEQARVEMLPPAYTSPSLTGTGESYRSSSEQPVKGEASKRIKTRESVRTVREKERGIKRTARMLERTDNQVALNPHSLRQKSVKSAGSTAKVAEKKARAPMMAARRSAQAAAKAQRSAQASRAAGKAATVTVRAASKAAVMTAKALAAAGRSLAALIAGGGTVGVVVIVVIVLIAMIAGSCYGVVFASEDSGTGLTIQSAVSRINGELSERIEKIKEDHKGEYDKVELVNADSITNWPEVIAVYAVKVTGDKESPEEVSTMTERKMDRLREICWDMNPLTAKLVSDEESTVLQITMTPKSCTDIMDEYDFTDDQKKMVKELLESGLLDKYKVFSSPEFTEEDFTAIEGTGGYIWPLQGYTRTSSPFGYRICPFHGRELHGGVDIPAPYGTAVHAAKSGRVVISNFGSSYGNYVVLAHGDGTRTLYAHMSARLVSVGQTVSQGQTIGRVGSTGSSTGNHLHFETWTGSTSGTRVNPMLYF